MIQLAFLKYFMAKFLSYLAALSHKEREEESRARVRKKNGRALMRARARSLSEAVFVIVHLCENVGCVRQKEDET